MVHSEITHTDLALSHMISPSCASAVLQQLSLSYFAVTAGDLTPLLCVIYTTKYEGLKVLEASTEVMNASFDQRC